MEAGFERQDMIQPEVMAPPLVWLVSDAAGGVSDEVWAHAAKRFDDEQLTALVILISFMNSVNRLNIITRQPCAGDYEPGMFG